MKFFQAWLELKMPSERKMRLYACALARYPSVWSLLTDERSRQAVEMAERYADGQAAHYALNEAFAQAPPAWDVRKKPEYYSIDIGWLCASQREHFNIQLQETNWIANTPQCPSASILAMIAGPWSRQCERCDGDGKAHGSDRPFEGDGPGGWPSPCPTCHGHGVVPQPLPTQEDCELKDDWCLTHQRELIRVADETRMCPGGRAYFSGYICTWNNNTVLRLAKSIYQECQWDALPVLADALEEAGVSETVACEVCRRKNQSCPHGDPNPILQACRADGGECLECRGTGNRRVVRVTKECVFCHGSGRLPAHFARGFWVLDLILGRG